MAMWCLTFLLDPLDTRVSFPGGKATGREADHLPPYSVEVKE
jgi:hypothetical protein